MGSEKTEKAVHEGFICDMCDIAPIVGARYHCTVKQDYDLCETCEEKANHPHPLIKYKVPVRPRGGNFRGPKCRPFKGPFGLFPFLWKNWANQAQENKSEKQDKKEEKKAQKKVEYKEEKKIENKEEKKVEN